MLRETPSLGSSARDRDARWLAWTARASSDASLARAVLASLAGSSLSRRASSWPLSTRSPAETSRSAMRPAMRKEASAEEAALSSPASRGAGSFESRATVQRTGRTACRFPALLSWQPPRKQSRAQDRAQDRKRGLHGGKAAPRGRPARRRLQGRQGRQSRRMAACSSRDGGSRPCDGTSPPPVWQGLR